MERIRSEHSSYSIIPKSSNSIALTHAFIDACRSRNNSLVIDTLDVWNENLPELNSEAIGAKYKAVKHVSMTKKETAVWHQIQALIQRLQSADRIVLGTPMWNFAPPYKLKQLIDLVAQRRYLFSYDGKQYGPMLNVAKAVAVYTRGSRFLEDSAIPASRFDHQVSYIDFWLEFIGVHDLRSAVVDDAWNESAEESARSIANASARLIDMTEWFLV
jgi:FMN-dependent NADH-azoreductase